MKKIIDVVSKVFMSLVVSIAVIGTMLIVAGIISFYLPGPRFEYNAPEPEVVPDIVDYPITNSKG